MRPNLVQRSAHYSPDRTLQVKPMNADLSEGEALNDESEAAYRQAIARRPYDPNPLLDLGRCLQLAGRIDEAETHYRQALALDATRYETHNNLGCLLKERGEYAEAEAVLRQALQLRPDYARGYNNLGNVLIRAGRANEAEAAYRHAIALKPDYADAYSNLGCLLINLHRLPEAEVASRMAYALDRDNALIQWNLSLCLLHRGQWQAAWLLYEARLDPSRGNAVAIPTLNCPRWQGESLQGRSLIVWTEQGFGDDIQFVRFLPQLKAQGLIRLTFFCKPALHRLFQGLDVVDTLVSLGNSLTAPRHDYWTFLLSIPRELGLMPDQLTAEMPYLQAPDDALHIWQARLPPSPTLRVGLVWKGNPAHSNDENRSLPHLRTLLPLWSANTDIDFYSVQMGTAAAETEQLPADCLITRLDTHIVDFADTAAALMQLDLLITVDTAIAHLAGALGRPCWVLLPYTGTDWRWRQEGDMTAWYPNTVRLFRQDARGIWDTVVQTIATALKKSERDTL